MARFQCRPATSRRSQADFQYRVRRILEPLPFYRPHFPLQSLPLQSNTAPLTARCCSPRRLPHYRPNPASAAMIHMHNMSIAAVSNLQKAIHGLPIAWTRKPGRGVTIAAAASGTRKNSCWPAFWLLIICTLSGLCPGTRYILQTSVEWRFWSPAAARTTGLSGGSILDRLYLCGWCLCARLCYRRPITCREKGAKRRFATTINDVHS